jgi:hypothetical protein
VIESEIGYNGLTLNDQVNRAMLAPPFYWYRVMTVDGLWDQDVRFEVHDQPHRHGTSSGDAYYSGRTLVISGQIYARTVGYLRAAQRALQEAFWDMQDHQLTFTLWGEVDVYITCRKNQKIDMPETQDRGGSTPWVRPFTIQLYADDPRMYAVAGDAVYPIWTA